MASAAAAAAPLAKDRIKGQRPTLFCQTAQLSCAFDVARLQPCARVSRQNKDLVDISKTAIRSTPRHIQPLGKLL